MSSLLEGDVSQEKPSQHPQRLPRHRLFLTVSCSVCIVYHTIPKSGEEFLNFHQFFYSFYSKLSHIAQVSGDLSVILPFVFLRQRKVLDKWTFRCYDRENSSGGHDNAAIYSGQYRCFVRSALVARKRACIVMRFLMNFGNQNLTV